jgi:hypothetical protein
LSRKIVLVIFIFLLLFAGIIALTQELDSFTDENNFESHEGEDINDLILNPKKPARWFKSNSGGLAIEEKKSRTIALRGEYALSIDSANPDELPEYLRAFYNEEYWIEVRTLYKNAAQIRTQWILRDINQRTKLISVIFETVEEKKIPAKKAEKIRNDVEDSEMEDSEENEIIEKERIEIIKRKNGFIEIFNDDLNLLTEYAYYKDGYTNKIDYEYNEAYLISSSSYKKEQSENDEKYLKTFTDYYIYNRAFSLRTIERVFYENMQAKEDDIVKISFPRNTRDVTNNYFNISERMNLYPEFFGDVYIESDSKMVFDLDSRGRILKQTLLDDKNEVLWVIENTWHNNRIVLTTKTEGELKLTAEYKYNFAGDMVSERNLRDGMLERTVQVDGNLEIEELYYNNVVILRAVWEEGVKISETRVK